MMTEIEVNDYISAAREALNDDPNYNRWFSALVEERKALSEKGCHSMKRVATESCRKAHRKIIVKCPQCGALNKVIPGIGDMCRECGCVIMTDTNGKVQ